MKKSNLFFGTLVLISLLAFSLTLAACDNGTTSNSKKKDPTPTVNYYGTLTVSNAPAGSSCIVFIYPSNILPTTKTDYANMTTSGIASGSGASPVTLNWVGGVKTGSYLVVVYIGGTRKYDVIHFSNGKGNVNYANLKNHDELQ